MARPVKYTPDSLQSAIDQYFQDCTDNGTFPDLPGMRLYLNISQDTLDRYAEDNNYAAILTRARDRRESYLSRLIVKEPRITQGILAALKQPANGGWTDGKDQSGPISVKLELSGIGDSAGK